MDSKVLRTFGLDMSDPDAIDKLMSSIMRKSDFNPSYKIPHRKEEGEKKPYSGMPVCALNLPFSSTSFMS